MLCWARAVGEFGATMMFANGFIGRTQTITAGGDGRDGVGSATPRSPSRSC
ncbi:MAG: hypothetical protein U0232_13425 [Thermomicrobiales bacterium]